MGINSTEAVFPIEGMNSTQLKALKVYFDEQEAAMPYLSEGQLMTKAAMSTRLLLKEVFPDEYVTRNVGHLLNYPTDGDVVTCSELVGMIPAID
jgi:hypothetical protein